MKAPRLRETVHWTWSVRFIFLYICLKYFHSIKYLASYIQLYCIYILLYLYDLFHILQSLLTLDPGNVMYVGNMHAET
jgi:hypothetical protein